MRRCFSVLLLPVLGVMWVVLSAVSVLLPAAVGLVVLFALAIVTSLVVGVAYYWFALPLLAPFVLPLFALYVVRCRQTGAGRQAV